MSARAVDLPPSSRTTTASEEEREAEQLPGATRPAPDAGVRRWFQPRNDSCPPGALIPGHICCHILNVYSWVAGSFGLISSALYFLHDPVAAAVDLSFWGFVAMSIVQVVVAVLRGWSFKLRYGILAATLLIDALIGALTIGVGPNLFFFILMLLSSAALFFGTWAGVGATLALAGILAAVGWGWVRGTFPIGIPREAAAAFLDFTQANVWVRVLTGTAICLAGLTVIAAQILRRLNAALAQSTTALARLDDEQRQRAQAVEALRASEERFSKVFRFSPDAICLADLETGRYLEVNDGFERLFGFTREEMIGRTSDDIGHWVDPREKKRMLDMLRQNGSVQDFQALGRRRNGEVGTFLVSAEIVEIAGRKALVTAGRDITLRLRSQEALRESEEKFSKAFRVSPISIFMTDFESGRVIDANDAVLRTYQCAREQIIGRTTFELGLWPDPVERDRLVAKLRSGALVQDFRIKGRTLPGTPITVLVNCVRVEIGGHATILTMLQDVTERERAEVALRESEEKFSKAFRSGPDAMAIADLETGCYLEVNEGFERLFGYPRQEVIGRTALELGFWPTPDARDAFVAQLRSKGKVRELEVEGRNRRHEPLTYLVNAECMVLGGRERIVLVTHDITDRKRAESERAFALARERQAREEFTRRLLAAQEAERRRIAGELHDSLGQNLLLVKNRAQLALAGGNIPDDQRWQFESIHDMATQAIAEVRQISHDLRPYQLDQLGLTRALEAMVDATARGTGLPMKRKIEAVDDVFTGEAATHFYRIVQESLNNILKHARATKAEVLVERDIHHVRLWIEDDGQGFTPDGAAGEGGGLGLKNIAERVRILGGSLQIDSGPGCGTRVEVLVNLP